MAKKTQREYELISSKSPKSPVAEAFRTLRTNLAFTGMDHSSRSILVTSPSPEDGKSAVAANLAVVLAQAGNRVILVDCDLRKPVQHKIFQVANDRGFTNCLVQAAEIEEAVIKTGVDNLDLLTSGPVPPNPAEILASKHMSNLLEHLLGKYDYVITDAPPLLAVTDAAILATQVDGVILVVRSANTRIDQAREAKNRLLKVNARLLGAVLNQVKVNSYGYQYYYYYYQESDDNEVKTRL
ncbi:MAG: CpsD/CapB family tyrosine-protein kinase [Syntrophomonadaceae bacterium]|nr:CpsD/CapB family tyrosine-protein kinase [Syntrophomonadaceae bacterium]